MVDQTMGFWNPADAKKPTGVGFSVGGDLTNVPLFVVAYRLLARAISVAVGCFGAGSDFTGALPNT